MGRALERARAYEGELVDVDGWWAVREQSKNYEPQTGQRLLDFEAEPSEIVMLRERGTSTWDAAERAAERGEVDRAIGLYELHLQERPDDARTWMEVGRLHHVRGALGRALACYRASLACASAPCAIALFNLGVVHEDLGADADARVSYERAIEIDATLEDAHFNAARVCERLGDRWCALQHLHAYRRLLR